MKAGSSGAACRMTPAIREELAMLRESLRHTRTRQDTLAEWWSGVGLDDRRSFLAFCGLDESAESARRPWQQLLPEHRTALELELKRLNRLTAPLRW
jgi:hypothetical protein